MGERYVAVFEDVTNGRFTVVCYGYFKTDKRRGCLFPTVEEAMHEYASNAVFIGLE